MLSLAESLVLLALDDEKGTVGWRSDGVLDLGLAGALLAELALHQRIGLEGRKVVALAPLPLGEPLLDEVLELIAGRTKPRDARGSVQAVAHHIKHLRERLCEGLVAQGILDREEHTTLHIFRRVNYPSSDPTPEQALRAERRAAASAHPPLEPRLLVLLSLAWACDLLDGIIAKEVRKQVATFVKEEPWGDAVRRAVQARRAAVSTVATTAAMAR